MGTIVGINSEGARVVHVRRPRRTRGINGGRKPTVDTYLMRWAQERGLRVFHIYGALGCSKNSFHNYVTRRYPFPARYLVALCDLLDCAPDDVLDESGYVRKWGT